jgi:outer membrane protein
MTVLLGISSAALAQGGVQSHADLLTPQFRFQHQSLSVGQPPVNEDNWRHQPLRRTLSASDGAASGQSGLLEQYDATVFYPVTEDVVNLDLGLNIKYLDGSLSGVGDSGYTGYQSALPMFYASAFFNISQGFKAGLTGSHTAYERNRSYDYQASISYTWDNGFGLQGGWQHQQLNLETDNDRGSNFESKGPFLDLHYRF